MARHEYGAAARGLGAQQVAHPANAGWVESVGGLVEDQNLWVAEQRGGYREPLAHAHRVVLHAPAGRPAGFDEAEYLVDPRVGVTAGRGEHTQVVATAATGWKLASSSTAPTCAGSGELR